MNILSSIINELLLSCIPNDKKKSSLVMFKKAGLYHLIEKNKMSIYDIKLDDITDQYMEYLFKMQNMDLEIASEFLVMAATLLHIKSKLLLPNDKKNSSLVMFKKAGLY